MMYRLEHDTMGEVKVPENRLWGAQTQRSLENFPVGPKASMPLEVIHAFGYLKKTAAMTNRDLGVLDEQKALLIGQICDEIIAGQLDDHFPLVVWQTGSGTHTNMNVNEVISNRVQLLQGKGLEGLTRLVHPNDDVNRSQSSNDTFPTAMHIAASIILRERTLPALHELHGTLLEKSRQFSGMVKIGRTHLMDATPLTLGQEFSGYAHLIERGLARLKECMESLSALALGGTAVGTGINCPTGFSEKAAAYISEYTGIPFKSAENKFAELSAHDSLVEAHGGLRQLAISLQKIGNDLRLLASGPRCGLAELHLPANEPGSSIMPGKVNPSQIESLTMVCAQVMGNDVALGFGASQGQFELNVYKPLIIANFLQSAGLLADSVQAFNRRCVKGLKADEERLDYYRNTSLMLVTALTPHIGYEKAAEIAKAAHSNKTTLKEEVKQSLGASDEQMDEWLDPRRMIGNSPEQEE